MDVKEVAQRAHHLIHTVEEILIPYVGDETFLSSTVWRAYINTSLCDMEDSL